MHFFSSQTTAAVSPFSYTLWKFFTLGRSIYHLGHTLSNATPFISDQDIIVRRAQYLSRVHEIKQEFSFASSATKFKVNSIYNSHFYGSPLWNLFGKAATSFIGAYNQSVRLMYGLPLNTHRNLIQPISKAKHVLNILISRFLGFIGKIRNSKKIIPKMLLSHIVHEVRSMTGRKRKVLLLLNKDDIYKVRKSDANKIEYFPLTKEDEWKSDLINELWTYWDLWKWVRAGRI